MIRVFGQITDASGKGVAGAMIELRALKSSTEVLYGSVFTYKCDASGHYEFPLAIGAYDAYAQNDICGDMDYLGTAVVTADTDDGDLHHILVDGGINITPPMLDAAMEFALRAEKAATSAKSDRIQTGKDVIVTDQNKHVAETKAQESATSADEAKAARDSIVQDANEVRHNTQQVAANAASVASNTTLVQRKAEQVAQNTQTVSTKAQQVSENTQSVAANTQAVSLMRDEVVAKTSMAQAAADTATQKAASAAEHDAAAAEYARQAQEAAQATAGALIDGGAADLSSGVYPRPVQVSGAARPTFWKVTNGGTVGGVDYGVGDTLIYTVAGSGSYYKIDNTESVTSVQGEKGAVTLTPEKIGADAAGTAAALVDQHAQKAGAHAISGVTGLTEALADKASVQELSSAVDDKATKEEVSAAINAHKAESNAHTPQNVGADPAGTAVNAVSNHEEKLDPHPQYLTNAEIGDLETRVAELERRKSTCLVNAVGTGAPHETVVAELPATVKPFDRLVLPNPFGNNTPVIVTVEAFLNNEWGETGYIYSSASANKMGQGIKGGYSQGNGIVIQAGGYTAVTSAISGGTHGYTGGSTKTPLPVRVFVRRIDD